MKPVKCLAELALPWISRGSYVFICTRPEGHKGKHVCPGDQQGRRYEVRW